MDRRKLLALGGAITVGALAGCAGNDDDNGTDDNMNGNDDTNTNGVEDAGVITVQADEDSVDTAFDRITTTIEENENLGIIAELDHSENAASVDMELPPTRVVFFGNPAAGTPLMQRSQRAGLDLPQRMLVWDDDGEIKITYNDPNHIAARHGIEQEDELLENIAGALESIATGEM